MLDWAQDLGLGFSMIASTGNQPDLNICDLLPLYAQDPGTKVVLAYLEMIPEPARFARILSRVCRIKPVIILKSGRTEAGAAAARSHTGSLAGNERVAEALIAKTGAIRVNTLEEAFLLASALGKMPRVRGNRVGIISNAGGPGTLVADALHDRGFELPLLSPEVRETLAREVLPQASTANPLDLVATASPEHYGKASKLMAESGIYDALIVIMVPPVTIETGSVAQAMIDVSSVLKWEGPEEVLCSKVIYPPFPFLNRLPRSSVS
jgi:acetyltransferase